LGARLPSGAAAPSTAGATRRTLARLSSSKGPWSLAALVPYGLGAGIGAAGNAVLAHSVGRAARQYFSSTMSPAPPRHDPVREDVGEGEVLDEPVGSGPVGSGTASGTASGIVDAEIVDAVIIETVRVRSTGDHPPAPG
ncbi:MAG TPA: hypothetical protein PKZ82_10300, partial [Microthrixaceae bacterium]|nr:hypothetical protein [Microthrixaceae bacterium]